MGPKLNLKNIGYFNTIDKLCAVLKQQTFFASDQMNVKRAFLSAHHYQSIIESLFQRREENINAIRSH